MAEKNVMNSLLMGFIVILVGLALFPTIQSTVDAQLVNGSTATQAIGDLVPLFWVIIVLGVAVGLVYVTFKE